MKRFGLPVMFAVLALCIFSAYYYGGSSTVSAKNQTITTTIINAQGEKIGDAIVMQAAKGVIVHVEASGLSPGWHALHFHETGKCETPDFKSAGEHYNPTNRKHGFDDPHGYHAGDLPNIFVDARGTVKTELFTDKVSLSGKGAPSLLKPGGTALIIHENADDYRSQPSGNAGARSACAVIAR